MSLMPAQKISMGNAWLEIDTGLFEQNVHILQGHIGEKTKICITMKADAYGHGIQTLMPSVMKLDIPYIGIANNREARYARDAGYTGKIMRLRSAFIDEIVDALDDDVEELIGCEETATELAGIAYERGRELRFHFALNSGKMSRDGLEVNHEKGKEIARRILGMQKQGLKMVGIRTHFALRDVAAIRSYLSVFQAEAEWIIQQAGISRSDVLLHAANSLATMDVPEAHLDLVRPGRILYGDSNYSQFLQFRTLKSRVAAINEYPAGHGVGYGHGAKLSRDARLANIPVGHSDGYRRNLGNQGHVLIHGQRAAIIGGVSMNTFMVDVTDIPDVRIGDEVVLFGKQGNEEISQEEMEVILGEFLVGTYSLWSRSFNHAPIKKSIIPE